MQATGLKEAWGGDSPRLAFCTSCRSTWCTWVTYFITSMCVCWEEEGLTRDGTCSHCTYHRCFSFWLQVSISHILSFFSSSFANVGVHLRIIHLQKEHLRWQDECLATTRTREFERPRAITYSPHHTLSSANRSVHHSWFSLGWENPWCCGDIYDYCGRCEWRNHPLPWLIHSSSTLCWGWT
jgi:hypothetical protein